MSNVPVSVAFGVIAALVANPSVWTAKLDGKDGSKISGTARVETVAPTPPPADSAMPPAGGAVSAGDLKVTVTVNNAAPNSSLTWNLRSGECDGKVAEAHTVGGASGSIKVDAQGTGTASTQVKANLPAGSDFHVAVNDGAKVAACGELEPAKTATEN